jgi:hypothetical protein|tara:strand:- start:45 stop:896 length:852 start_codon:yes stop_codon:yes gene_type:complete
MSDNQEVAVPAVPEEKPVLSGDPVEKTPEQIQDDWKAGLSDDLRADKSLENIKDISSLAKSYIHAQRLVGADKIPVPNKFATEKDWDAVYEKLGRPKTADEYKYNLSEDQKVDTEALKNFSSQAHKLGLLPTQAQGMVNYYNEMVGKQLADAESISTSQREKAMTELKTEWGQAYDQKLQKANTVVSSVFPKGIMSINLEDGTKLGDHSEVIKAFAALGEKMGEDDIIKSDGPVYMTPKQIEKQIGELQQTGSAYWDKNHPNHDTAVQEVQTLIQKKNNEEVV